MDATSVLSPSLILKEFFISASLCFQNLYRKFLKTLKGFRAHIQVKKQSCLLKKKLMVKAYLEGGFLYPLLKLLRAS